MSMIDPLLAKEDISDLSQERRWELLDGHYDRLRKMLMMVARGKKSLIVNGDAGMGKTEFTNDIIKGNIRKKGKYEKHSGSLTAVELYVKLHKYRKEGDVFVIDDTDRIFDSVESIEVLKAALDTSETDKTVDWGKAYSTHLARHKCPTSFNYSGRVVIITNRNIRSAPSKIPTHKQAMLAPLKSRMGYFPAGLPNNEWKIEALRMFAAGYQSEWDKTANPYELRCAKGIKLHPLDDSRGSVLKQIIDFIEEHQDDLSEISFRTVYQAIGYRNEYPADWGDIFIVDQFYSDE
jgi:tRNA A37 threonylcarbamoyladenosine biosynthesis protein TsaE